MIDILYRFAFALIFMLFAFNPSDELAAQSLTDQSSDPIERQSDIRYGTAENPVMTAVRIPDDSMINLDGFLDEDVWSDVPVATGFTQRFPHDGRPATEKTEVKILYTDSAIYVGVMAYESSPDSILAPLFRRDGAQPSDWFYVSFDSYNDNRTAFTFAINPRGVQKDILYYNDSREDILWDAVWEAETQILDNGWSAEIRIPLSQLRFSSISHQHLWGVNFQRRIARKGEISFWAPTSQRENRLVSRFGVLNGIENLDDPRRLEIIPYAAISNLMEPDLGDGNPFYSRNQLSGNFGGDIQYGLSSNFTLTATVNPDFGQVEADPSIINLTANETFFAERRPFFIEGFDIFRFGTTKTFSSYGNPDTFYSRRIGRTPQGSPDIAGENPDFVDQPDQTTIASAVKVSGKSDSGWSVGALNAFTLQENADFSVSGQNRSIAVEPATNYFVSRIMRDFNSGNTYTGGFMSAVNRDIGNRYFEDFLHSSAYLGGIDFEHNFRDREWVASGVISFSHINGSEQAISQTQRSPVRYLNRVDSENLKLDENLTSMSGFATELSIQKQSGDNWMGSLTYSEASPSYEVNDLGFQVRADYRAIEGGVVYRETDPGWAQYYEFYLFSSNAWNYDGDRISHGYISGGFMRFNNLWTSDFRLVYNAPRYTDRLTRGGPVMEQTQGIQYNFSIGTNPNKQFSNTARLFHRHDNQGGYTYDYSTEITTRPTTWLQVSFTPQIVFERNMAQYIQTVYDPAAVNTFGNRYVFSEIDQTTLIGTFRFNWTFSTTMSLQTYVRPFIASGNFKNFKELAEPRSFNFDIYGDDIGTISISDGVYTIDPDGTGSSEFSFNNPDFNFRSIQGNAVFRWEYRPGSTLFLVWQQQRENFAGTGDFDFSRDMSELFRTKSTNVFLIKASFWFGT